MAQDKNGVPTWCKFFGKDLAAQLEGCGQQADVIHAHNVLAHVADLNGFVAGLRIVLKDTGVAVIEVPYVKDLIDNVEFDTIYHEHLCYFSLTSLTSPFCAARTGDSRRRADRHSWRLAAIVRRARRAQSSARVQTMLDEEAAWGVDRADFYLGFGQQRRAVAARAGGPARAVSRAKGGGSRSTALRPREARCSNYFKIGRDIVDFVVDRNTFKQGRYTPGTHLKIHSPDKLVEDKPDYVLLLSWNFADEILAQQAAYRQRGGRFIIPIPSVKVA